MRLQSRASMLSTTRWLFRTARDLRPKNKVLGLEYLRDGRVNVSLDGSVLRLQIEQRNIHSQNGRWIPGPAFGTQETS